MRGELIVNVLAPTPRRPITRRIQLRYLKPHTLASTVEGAGISCFLPQNRIGTRVIMVELSTERHSKVCAPIRSTEVRCFPKNFAPLASTAADRPRQEASISLGEIIANFITKTTTSISYPTVVINTGGPEFGVLRSKRILNWTSQRAGAGPRMTLAYGLPMRLPTRSWARVLINARLSPPSR